jgi:hypothetical protein
MTDDKITDTAAKAELRARAEALRAENSAPLPDAAAPGDARLIEAERRFRVSEKRRHALYDEFASVLESEDDGIWPTEKALLDVVDQIVPRTFVGAMAKLRVIIWNEDMQDHPTLRQVMDCLERVEADFTTAVKLLSAPGPQP